MYRLSRNTPLDGPGALKTQLQTELLILLLKNN